MSEEAEAVADDELLLSHEEKIQQITLILHEQHTDYQESISKLSSSNRKLKLKVKELFEKMGPLGAIKGSIDQLLTDIISGTREDKHVIQALKEENSELTTEVLSMKIICESLQEKYQEIATEMRRIHRQGHNQTENQSQSQGRPSSAAWPTMAQAMTTGRGREEENFWREDLLKLEEKIQRMDQTIQHISTHQERERQSLHAKDRPMGISEMRPSSEGGRDLRGNGPDPSSRIVTVPHVVIDDDALSLISETWHGSLATHDSRPNFNPLTQQTFNNTLATATATAMMSTSMNHRYH
jgi:chromosome segregation ATPase